MMAGDLEEAEQAFFLGIRQVRHRALEVCNPHKEATVRPLFCQTCHLYSGCVSCIVRANSIQDV